MTTAARLELVILAVGDPARAARFYEAAFGWPRLVDVPVYIELDAGGVRVGLYERDAFASNTGQRPSAVGPGALACTELYLRVASLAPAIAGLEAAGGRCLSPRAARPWGDEAAYFADLDGNVVVVAAPAVSPG